MRLFGEGCGDRERITDLYLITILFVFLLFPGLSGYQDITFSKYVFLMAATGAWLAGLALLSARGRGGPLRPGAPQAAALIFLAVCLISWLCSPYRAHGFLGISRREGQWIGRYDGLLTTACYVLMFLGISLFTRPKPVHAAAFAAGVTVCCAIGVAQLFGRNPLGLFPSGLGYYDAGTFYSGTYLGTIGNTNILDAVLCMALPLFFALYVCEAGGAGSALYLLPLFPGCFVEVSAGGTGAALALAAGALAAGPLLVAGSRRLRRALRGGAVVLLAAGLALAYRPDYMNRALTPRFVPAPAAVAALLAAAGFLALSFLPAGRTRFRLPGGSLRRFFLLLDAVLILGGLAAVFFWTGDSGPVYELSRALHGQLEDGFGSSRVRIWRGCLALVPERPLTGGGPGTLAMRLEIEFSRYVPETGRTLTAFVDNAHNIYLGYLVNCGVPGLAADLGLLFCAARVARRAAGRPMIPALALAVLCGAVHGLFGLGLCISEPFFWAALGLLCSDKEAAI